MITRFSKIMVAGIALAASTLPANSADKFMWRSPERGGVLVQSLDVGGPTTPTDPGTPTNPTDPQPGAYDPTPVISDKTLNKWVFLDYTGPSLKDTRGTFVKFAYTGLPAGLTYDRSTGKFRGSLHYAQPKIYDVTVTATGRFDGKDVSKSTTFKIEVVNPVSQLAVRQGELGLKRNDNYVGTTLSTLTGKWQPTNSPWGVDTFAEYTYVYSGLPGTIKSVYDSATQTYHLEGYTGAAEGTFTAQVQVTEKVWSKYVNINASDVLQSIDAARVVQTNVATVSFPVTVSNVQDTAGKFFRITTKSARNFLNAHASEIEFKDDAANILSATNITFDHYTNPLGADLSGLINGNRGIEKEVRFCGAATCDDPTDGVGLLTTFVVEFASPVTPRTIGLYSRGADDVFWVDRLHYFTHVNNTSLLIERSQDGVNWAEIAVSRAQSQGAKNGAGVYDSWTLMTRK
jgi:hypothetical protein